MDSYNRRYVRKANQNQNLNQDRNVSSQSNNRPVTQTTPIIQDSKKTGNSEHKTPLNRKQTSNVNRINMNSPSRQPINQKLKTNPNRTSGNSSGGNKLKNLFSWKNKKLWQKILYVLIILLFVVFLVGVSYLLYEIITLPPIDPNNFNFIENSQILDVNSAFYQDFQSTEVREIISIEQIPKHVQLAFISIEDERFYSHNGVDFLGLTRAVFGILTSGSLDGPGGSTITQQLIKLTHLTSDKTVTRKIQEMILATRLENNYSKDQILEAYLNKINLSQAWGVQAASKTFFAKDVSELTIAQAAILAAIPKSPSYYDPYTYIEDESGNTAISKKEDGSYVLSETNAERALNVVTKMFELNHITLEEKDIAINEITSSSVGLTYFSIVQEYSYFTDALYEQILDDLQNKNGMDESAAVELILNGGLTIHSTVDPFVQTTMEEAAKNDDLFPDQSYLASEASAAKSADTGEAIDYVPQVGMTVIDNNTGYVAGIVGGREKNTNLSINRAMRQFQPGSSTKPLTAYAPGIDTGVVTLGTVFNDVPFDYYGWRPTNSGGGSTGLMTVREGLVNSTNTIAVQSVLKTGVEVCAEYAEKAGLSINREEGLDINPSAMALGGYSIGQTPLAMASAFSIFPNSGTKKTYSFYTKILDKDGNVILEFTPEETQVYSPQTAYLITDVLQSAVQGGTTYINVPNQPVAGKTGTTDNERHAWICGYTPYYSMAVWYGYDENNVETSAGNYELDINIFGGSKPGPASMFEHVMQNINQDKESASFPDNPGGIVNVTIDRSSGKLATDLTAADPRGNNAITEMFIDGTAPSQSDDSHYKVKLCNASGMVANEFCPLESVEEVVGIKILPELYPSGVVPLDQGYIGGRDRSVVYKTEVCTTHNAQTAAASKSISLIFGGSVPPSDNVQMSVGTTQTLTANGPNNSTTNMTSSNNSVVSIIQSGNSATLNAVGLGTSTITVTQSMTVGDQKINYTKSITIQVK